MVRNCVFEGVVWNRALGEALEARSDEAARIGEACRRPAVVAVFLLIDKNSLTPETTAAYNKAVKFYAYGQNYFRESKRRRI